MFKDIVTIFKEIQSTSSRTGKELILKQNENNEEFKSVLKFLYNPYELTGLKTKKLVKYAHFQNGDNGNLVTEFNNVFQAIDYITTNNTGRDEDAMTIRNFINLHTQEEHDFLQELFTKDFKCGITAATINKIYGKNYIPKFEVMLAKKYEDEQHKIKGDFTITLKLDGIRCVAIKENGNVKFFSRQGQQIDGLVELEEDYKNLPDNMVYDGELLLADKQTMSSDELFRATQKVVRKDGDKYDVDHILYDNIPLGEFYNGKSKKIYSERRKDLNNLKTSGHIFVLPSLYQGKDKNKVYEYLDEATSRDLEGVMVNNSNGYYVTKRTDTLLKVKKMHTVDLKVLDIEEGTGKNKGKLGALIVDYKGFPCGVGSGFTDEEREYFWTITDELIGRVVEVQYFEESTNEQGGVSLRFPVFKGIRELGKEVSYF